MILDAQIVLTTELMREPSDIWFPRFGLPNLACERFVSTSLRRLGHTERFGKSRVMGKVDGFSMNRNRNPGSRPSIHLSDIIWAGVA